MKAVATGSSANVSGLSAQPGDGERHEADERQRQRARGSDHAGGDLAGAGARVQRVESGVDHAVERHGRGAGPDHRERHPAERRPPGPAAGGQQHADVGERQREQRVLETDQPQVGGKARRQRRWAHARRLPPTPRPSPRRAARRRRSVLSASRLLDGVRRVAELRSAASKGAYQDRLRQLARSRPPTSTRMPSSRLRSSRCGRRAASRCRT
jgi:hypothetical protein